MESRLFERILLNEDNAMAYAINLHREMAKQNTIQKFNWKDFNKNRLENGNKLNDTKIVFGGGSCSRYLLFRTPLYKSSV